uniref:Major facilitator superfamily (MFS) profile domain-containing protein n=2 Tax=Octopus bimaculoides TaxID=37653 RepID=A0A0L8I106_OCTBM
MIDVDSLFISLKEKGAYQISQYVVCGLSFLPIVLSSLKIVFIGFIPGSKCAALNTSQLQEYGYDSNETHEIAYEACQININSLDGSSKNESLECINGYSYDHDRYISFLSEWDLVCGKAGLAELTQTLYAVGGVVGSLSMPYLCDTRGRKPILVLCGIISLIVSIGSSFSPNYIVFAVLRGLEGIFIQGISVACVTIMLEFLEESLRWVVTNGFVERSKKIIKRASKYNGVDFDRIWGNNMKSSLIPLVSSENKKKTPSKEDLNQQDKVKEGFHTIFKDSLARKISIIVLFIGLTNTLTYYGIYLTSSELAGDHYLNFFLYFRYLIVSSQIVVVSGKFKAFVRDIDNGFIYSITDAPQRRHLLIRYKDVQQWHYSCVYPVCLFFVQSWLTTWEWPMAEFELRTQRTGTDTALHPVPCAKYSASPLPSGGAYFIGTITDGKKKVFSIINTVFSMMGMFGISASNCIMWLYTPEVYPTNLRNIGLGFLAFCDSIGSMISPYFRILMLYVPWLPGTIFAIGTLTSVCLLNFMPETQRLQMPTTMDDVRKQLEAQKRKKKNPSSEENYQDSNLTQA